MQTLLLASLLLSQCGRYDAYRSDYNVVNENPIIRLYRPQLTSAAIYSFYVPMYSPWNQAVSELRAGRVRKSLSSESISTLQELDSQKQTLWIQLIEADKKDKAELLKEYRRAKERLNTARLLASRELR